MNIPYIINIQKYSIHDGDGIRTTAFFKGCPLKCTWCHNPESQSYAREVLYYTERCTGCTACAHACPNKAIIDKHGHVDTDRSRCDLCGTCLDYCLNNAREIVGKQYSIPELVKELTKDAMFYEESHGGVTLSGGEVMAQDMDYIEELVKRLHRQGIDVTIDTCGQAPYENFRRILPYVSTFLYDFKLMDSEQHRKYTAFGNETILDNLKRLSADGARIYIRIPTIEGVNADDGNMRAIIAFLKEYVNVAQVNLLPYHNTGKSKYEKLARTYEGEAFAAPSSERMEELLDLFRAAGFSNTKIGG